MTRFLFVAALTGCLACAAPAWAQEDRTRIDSQHGAELSLFGGAAADGFGLGPSFGWSMAWRPSNRVAIEGSGSWMPTLGPQGFAALFGPRIYLRTTGRASPYITLEGGLFHASVDPAAGGVPDFYLDRMEPSSPEKAYNDFVAAAGGGFDMRVKGRIWIRPHARFLVAVDGWRTYSSAIAGVHLSFKFSDLATGP
jgi:hypothetical protein